ncbi:MAG: FxsA family protein [Candidatus Omnitrophica bacterium]|nr:FxsA family protein [Candidatus Omnitrophota bacterium]
MGLIIFVAILGLPIAEFWVITRVGAVCGFWNTFLLLILSAVFGVHFAKIQGQAVLGKVQQCLAEGRVPNNEMLDGLLVFLGGVLFVIPGFITDGLGLVLIFPPTRWLIRWWVSRSSAAFFVARTASPRTPEPAVRPITDGKFTRGEVQDAEIVDKKQSNFPCK